jgi:hypothetical protein
MKMSLYKLLNGGKFPALENGFRYQTPFVQYLCCGIFNIAFKFEPTIGCVLDSSSAFVSAIYEVVVSVTSTVVPNKRRKVSNANYG